MKIAIIGGGAAGCFAAIEVKRRMPMADVTVMESGRKLLAKVAVTGGGRCNLTNSFAAVKSLGAVYPRGERMMKRLLMEFSHRDAYEWFEREGVRLVTQDDECVFPQSQDAMEIVGTLTRLMQRLGVRVMTSARVTRIAACGTAEGGFDITIHRPSLTTNHPSPTTHYDAVVVTTGGSPKLAGLEMLNGLDINIVAPVPSLFSFCIANDSLKSLMGIVVDDVSVALPGTKLRARDTILLTHWGVSGPAVLKLSSYAARLLHERDYKAQIAINWMGEQNETQVAEELGMMAAGNMQKQLGNVHPEHINSRLWHHLLQRAGLRPDQRWGELGRKSFNRMAAVLTNDTYPVEGKNRFKDEFVTCGGVSLASISQKTLESKHHPGLFFAGEVLDVDAITGGFNLQAAWTMGYVAAKNIAAALTHT